MNRWFVVALIVAVLGLALGIVGLLLVGGAARDATAAPDRPDPGLEGLVMPAFGLTDQLGRPVDQSVFEGRATVLTFMFTHCTTVCPLLNGEMARLHVEFEGGDVQQVSVSVDPLRDSPDVLKAYGERFGIDHDRWRMLTGDEATMHEIASALKFAVQEDPSEASRITLPDGTEMANILHPSRLILIGPGREVLGLYSFQDPDELTDLVERAERLADSLR